MPNTDANDALYDKMAAEQQAYREWLLSRPPDEILNHCYEYTIRDDILYYLEDNDLTQRQAKALLKSPSPLADVYDAFTKRESDHMDNIRDTIETRANAVIAAEKAKAARKDR